MPGDSGYVITPADRTTLLAGPLGAVLMLGGGRTAGRLSLVEHPLQPRALGSPMHTHRDEDEYSVVLEGQVGAQIGAQAVVAGPGDVLVKPRGVPHAFWNPADEPARLLEIISPAGFEGYFAGLAHNATSTPLTAMLTIAERIAQAGQEQQAGRLEGAEALYRQVLAEAPQDAGFSVPHLPALGRRRGARRRRSQALRRARDL